ncbi:MAG: MerR family DNA-binding transcriptional regulator [Halieaceae bacterium]
MIQNTYSISDLAREFDITTRALRFYEEKGLLRPEREGQKRLFSPADRVRLELILRGKRIGLTLEESRGIIDMYERGQDNAEQLNSLLGKIDERRQSLRAQLQDIQAMLSELDDVQARCQHALKNIEEEATA